MPAPLNRRTFLTTTGGLCAGAALSPWLSRAAAAETAPRPWLVTARDAILRHTGQPDCWSALKSVGAEGLEALITEDLALSGLFHPRVKYTAATAAGVEQVTADAAAAGQRITAFCMFNRFDERPELEISWCREVARRAKELGVPAIRIDVVPHKLSSAEFLPFAIETLRKVLAETEATGVKFAIENHGHTTNDPEFLTPLFQGVGSDRLGLTLDTGNFYWFGHPLTKLYQLYATFASRVFHTHCKSIHYPESEREKQRPVGWKYGEYHGSICEGDIDFARVVTILKQAGYSNDLCVENESLGKLSAAEATATLRREVELLKRLRA